MRILSALFFIVAFHAVAEEDACPGLTLRAGDFTDYAHAIYARESDLNVFFDSISGKKGIAIFGRRRSVKSYHNELEMFVTHLAPTELRDLKAHAYVIERSLGEPWSKRVLIVRVNKVENLKSVVRMFYGTQRRSLFRSFKRLGVNRFVVEVKVGETVTNTTFDVFSSLNILKRLFTPFSKRELELFVDRKPVDAMEPQELLDLMAPKGS